ncbi:unnamed protein product [Closterium sp. NIES-64]|nr:unnamed protein product [Closterium sp. NIES-64]
MALLPASPSLLSTTAAAWRPRGVLVAQLHEHRAAVPALAVAGNSQWFATASHDGTVKVWDATRLDRGTAFRSKLTYAPGGAAVAGAGKATAVAVMGDSATAAVGYASGEVHVVHVDYAPRFLSSPDSYRCITRMASLEPASWSSPSSHAPGAARGPILSVHSWAASTLGATPPSLSASSSSLFSCNPLSSSHALLLVASLHGGITLWDMRAARPALSLHLHAALGAPTHVLPDPHHGLWLLAASSCSALCLWDLRFLLPLSSWRLPSAPSAPHPPPITALAPMLPAAFPPAGDAMGAAAAGGPEHLPGWFGADRGSAATKGAVGAAGGGAAAAAGAGGQWGGRHGLWCMWRVAGTRWGCGVFSVAPQPSSSTAPPPPCPLRSNLPTALQSRPTPAAAATLLHQHHHALTAACSPPRPACPSALCPSQHSQRSQAGQGGARQARQSLLRVEQLKEPPGRAGGVRALLGVPGGGALLTAGTDCCIPLLVPPQVMLLPSQVVAVSGQAGAEWVVSGPTARGARGEVLHPRYDCASCTARESFRCVHYLPASLALRSHPLVAANTILTPTCLPLGSSHPSNATPSHASSILLHPPQETPPPFYVDAARQRGSATSAALACMGAQQPGGAARAESGGQADARVRSEGGERDEGMVRGGEGERGREGESDGDLDSAHGMGAEGRGARPELRRVLFGELQRLRGGCDDVSCSGGGGGMGHARALEHDTELHDAMAGWGEHTVCAWDHEWPSCDPMHNGGDGAGEVGRGEWNGCTRAAYVSVWREAHALSATLTHLSATLTHLSATLTHEATVICPLCKASPLRMHGGTIECSCGLFSLHTHHHHLSSLLPFPMTHQSGSPCRSAIAYTHFPSSARLSNHRRCHWQQPPFSFWRLFEVVAARDMAACAPRLQEVTWQHAMDCPALPSFTLHRSHGVTALLAHCSACPFFEIVL